MELKGPGVPTSKALKRISRSTSILFISIVVYTVILSGLSVQRYRTYNAGMYDLGIMEQTIWNTSQGRILTSTVNMGYPVSRFWNGRWELMYLPIALLHRIFPYPSTALIIQTIVLALGVIPIYLLAVDKLGKGILSTTLPITYLLYPPLHNANLFDIHGITLATPMILFAFYFLNRRAMAPFYLFLVLLLFCREDASLIAFMLGLYALVIIKERRAGISVMALSFLWLLLIQNVHHLRPIFDLPPLNDPNLFPSRWERVGGSSPLTFAMSIVQDPLGFLRLFWGTTNLKLIIKLFGPVGFISWLNPSSLALMMPNLIVNMISSSPVSKNIYHHYTGAVTPVVFISTIFGIAYLLRVGKSLSTAGHSGAWKRLIHPVTLSIGILSSTLLACLLWSRVPDAASYRVTSHHEVNDRKADMIPGKASVSVHFFLAPHVAQREGLFLFPDKLGEAEYIFYDLNLPFNRLMSHTMHSNPAVDPVNEPFLSLLDDRRYGIVDFEDGTIVFKKGADYNEGLRLFRVNETERDWENLNGFDFGGINLVGIRREGISGYTEKLLHVTLYWQWNGGGISDDFFVTLALTDGDRGSELIHRPFFGRLGEVGWEIGDIIRDDLFIPLTGVYHGSYDLVLTEGSKDGRMGYPKGLTKVSISPEDVE